MIPTRADFSSPSRISLFISTHDFSRDDPLGLVCFSPPGSFLSLYSSRRLAYDDTLTT